MSATKAFDPFTPSFKAAIYWAREAGWEAMRGAGRDTLTASDRAAGNAVLARLMWLVEGGAGGFMGLDDRQVEHLCKRVGLTSAEATAAMFTRGTWPARPQSVAA